MEKFQAVVLEKDEIKGQEMSIVITAFANFGAYQDSNSDRTEVPENDISHDTSR